MPDMKRNIYKYSYYFRKQAPEAYILAIAITVIGLLGGTASALAVHYSHLHGNFAAACNAAGLGAVAGFFVIAMPALLTASFIKVMRRRMLLKHVLLMTLVVALSYAVFIIVDSLLFALLMNYVFAYVLILLANAGVYGYWLIMAKVVAAQRKRAVITATVNPLMNVLLYFGFGRYIIDISLPIGIVLIKLAAGMSVLLATVYLFLYVVDRPMKKMLNVSSVAIFTTMVNQWLYNMGSFDIANPNFGEKRGINVDLLALRGKGGGYKAIFVKPEIHYGPFAGVGGGIATAYIGGAIKKKFNAAPFVMHGAVNISQNPISTAQIAQLSKRILNELEALPKNGFKAASGGIGFGYKKPCSAITIEMNNLRIVTLTKAPFVTEDIESGVGRYFARVASSGGSKNVIVVDAHNSRYENAKKEELAGIYKKSRYVGMYKSAILQSLKTRNSGRIAFGAASQKIKPLLDNSADIGEGYSSVGVFSFGNGQRFCMIYLDANNMLPKLRQKIVKHVKVKFGMNAEAYTTDTHSVNSLAYNVSNVLGRHVDEKRLLSILDSMIDAAVGNMEPVYMQYKNFTVENFRVWGRGADRKITKASKEIVRNLNRLAPVIITAGFVAAAFAISVI
ncbi:MAG: DUF2070 family protein [Candidatus Micrarchaeaceae archaeon]